jgi:hypothetical protein
MVAVCEWYEVGRKRTPINSPWQAQVLVAKYVTDGCPVEVI